MRIRSPVFTVGPCPAALAWLRLGSGGRLAGRVGDVGPDEGFPVRVRRDGRSFRFGFGRRGAGLFSGGGCAVSVRE